MSNQENSKRKGGRPPATTRSREKKQEDDIQALRAQVNALEKKVSRKSANPPPKPRSLQDVHPGPELQEYILAATNPFANDSSLSPHQIARAPPDADNTDAALLVFTSSGNYTTIDTDVHLIAMNMPGSTNCTMLETMRGGTLASSPDAFGTADDAHQATIGAAVLPGTKVRVVAAGLKVKTSTGSDTNCGFLKAGASSFSPRTGAAGYRTYASMGLGSVDADEGFETRKGMTVRANIPPDIGWWTVIAAPDSDTELPAGTKLPCIACHGHEAGVVLSYSAVLVLQIAVTETTWPAPFANPKYDVAWSDAIAVVASNDHDYPLVTQGNSFKNIARRVGKAVKTIGRIVFNPVVTSTLGAFL